MDGETKRPSEENTEREHIHHARTIALAVGRVGYG